MIAYGFRFLDFSKMLTKNRGRRAGKYQQRLGFRAFCSSVESLTSAFPGKQSGPRAEADVFV